MKKIKISFLTILILLTVDLVAEQMKYQLSLNTVVYYAKYPKYRLEQPIMGLQTQCYFFSIFEGVGIGGSSFQKVYSIDNRFKQLKTYSGYIHNFTSFTSRNSYFIYGFYGGIKRTEIEIEDSKISSEIRTTIHRPLIGFHYASEQWGMDVYWSQSENRRPILSYEIKLRNSNGILIRLGRINRGPISGIDSEIYLMFGYELFN
ncbi:MAG: hypothetical protein K9N07_03650 [Candidatus Cloacimonetes bacterium]|nr:hypothetical protein [Candidatus Cloacimonadota bacterium]